MKHTGQSFEEALQELRKIRPAANPNPGFVTQLKKLYG